MAGSIAGIHLRKPLSQTHFALAPAARQIFKTGKFRSYGKRVLPLVQNCRKMPYCCADAVPHWDFVNLPGQVIRVRIPRADLGRDRFTFSFVNEGVINFCLSAAFIKQHNTTRCNTAIVGIWLHYAVKYSFGKRNLTSNSECNGQSAECTTCLSYLLRIHPEVDRNIN